MSLLHITHLMVDVLFVSLYQMMWWSRQGQGRGLDKQLDRCFVSFKRFNYRIEYKISCLFLDLVHCVYFGNISTWQHYQEHCLVKVASKGPFLRRRNSIMNIVFCIVCEAIQYYMSEVKILHLLEILKACVVFTVKYINDLLLPFRFLGTSPQNCYVGILKACCIICLGFSWMEHINILLVPQLTNTGLALP